MHISSWNIKRAGSSKKNKIAREMFWVTNEWFVDGSNKVLQKEMKIIFKDKRMLEGVQVCLPSKVTFLFSPVSHLPTSEQKIPCQEERCFFLITQTWFMAPSLLSVFIFDVFLAELFCKGQNIISHLSQFVTKTICWPEITCNSTQVPATFGRTCHVLKLH